MSNTKRISIDLPCPVVGHTHAYDVAPDNVDRFKGKRLGECPDLVELAEALPYEICDECGGIATWAKTHDGPITETCHRCGGTGREPLE